MNEWLANPPFPRPKVEPQEPQGAWRRRCRRWLEAELSMVMTRMTDGDQMCCSNSADLLKICDVFLLLKVGIFVMYSVFVMYHFFWGVQFLSHGMPWALETSGNIWTIPKIPQMC